MAIRGVAGRAPPAGSSSDLPRAARKGFMIYRQINIGGWRGTGDKEGRKDEVKV